MDADINSDAKMTGIAISVLLYTQAINYNTEIFCRCTLMCLKIGTPKNIYFPYGKNGKLMGFRYPNISACKGILSQDMCTYVLKKHLAHQNDIFINFH